MTVSRRNVMMMGGVALAAPAAAGAAIAAVTPRQFDSWLELRGGLDRPAYWYSDGLVRSIKDGSVQSRMLGVETWSTARTSPTTATSISRKIFFFLRTDADEIMADEAGKPRRPSIYVYQLRKFSLTDGEIGYYVESHDLNAVRPVTAKAVYTVDTRGDQTHINYAVFRGGVTGEVYDYFDNGPRHADVGERYQMAWVGTTTTAATVANQHGWRFNNFDDVPNPWLKKTVRERFPLWMAPPKDLAEIDTLRSTIPYKVEGL